MNTALIWMLIFNFILVCFPGYNGNNQNNKPTLGTNDLPAVLSKNHSDLISSRLRDEAKQQFSLLNLPDCKSEWERYSVFLRNKIREKAVVHVNHGLPLNIREFDSIPLNGYTIKNIAFQTLPGVYATANLFVPEGKGPFPAVINLHAHSGRFDDNDQAVGHSLAASGYVCLSIDPWGAGERTTIHGLKEYHGANLGASLMNVGESLMGLQISDNMRGIDLLCSLPYVDDQKIGATGASGGGNQTMWLTAADDRIKAAVLVVSVGTFESYVMRSNCICELLIDGMTFTEESGILALAEAIMPCNHTKDKNPTFYTSEMLRSYDNAYPVFKMLGKEENISNKIFDLPHGFLMEDREAMLGWFDYQLKGIGSGAAKKENPYHLLSEKDLMVYPKGQRDSDVLTTEDYCKWKGNELRKHYLNKDFFTIENKKKELKAVLRLPKNSILNQIHKFPLLNNWERFALQTNDNKIIPMLHLPPVDPSLGYVILCDPLGKKNIPAETIDEYREKGVGLVVVDLTGTGETESPLDKSPDKKYIFHTISRAELWLGRTIMGEWVQDIQLVSNFLLNRFNAEKIIIDGDKEAGLAGLYFGALNDTAAGIILRNAPVSYLFDDRESVDFYSMAIHLPGFLQWGDISLAAVLSGKDVTFINPVTMSGQKISDNKLNEYKKEFKKLRSICNQSGNTFFQSR